MKIYQSKKIIKAQKATFNEYLEFIKENNIPPHRHGKTTRQEEDKEGYIVGYSNADFEFNSNLFEGCYYFAWSPKSVFEAGYDEI
jgi:hypothetical protein